ncbi:MAG: magnesium transporter [bacterium]|nr:magnesium transporter [bacterium]
MKNFSKIQKNNSGRNKENRFPPESAGRVMIKEAPAVLDSATIGEIENLLLKETKNFETINYIYLIDAAGRLVGTLSVKDIFRLPKTAAAAESAERKLVAVRPHTDQERVAILAIRHNLKAIPVVDAENRFLGVVPSDAILNILHQEHIEDALRSAGIGKFKDPAKELVAASATLHFKKRFPWLIIGMLGGMLAALAVGFFENLLDKMLILAAFIPAVVYMADAVGVQTQTLFIRRLAIDRDFDFRKYLNREAAVGIALAIALAFLVVFFSLIFWKSAILSLILGISFFITIAMAVAVAIVLPWIFYAFNYDPAVASGPFATVIRDILSILIYLAVASLVLNVFPV